jgi:hypothetical protein
MCRLMHLLQPPFPIWYVIDDILAPPRNPLTHAAIVLDIVDHVHLRTGQFTGPRCLVQLGYWSRKSEARRNLPPSGILCLGVRNSLCVLLLVCYGTSLDTVWVGRKACENGRVLCPSLGD